MPVPDHSAVLLALVAGLLVAVTTAPVGVSGAVFLMPVQLDVLHVPGPAVTPTNLLFNVVSTPAALLRYRRAGSIDLELTRRLVAGTLPGVVAGTLTRVYLAPGDRVFRVLVAAVLLPIGVSLCLRRTRRPRPGPGRPHTPGCGTPGGRAISGRAISGLGAAVGVIGGVYGIGGGSLLGPILVGAGMTVGAVAPAALLTTFLTSVVGVVTYGLLALTDEGLAPPAWAVGVLCGLGGLVGGYLGARVQPYVPERALRVLLGVLAVGLAVSYLLRAVG